MKTITLTTIDTSNSILFSFDDNNHFINGNDGMVALSNIFYFGGQYFVPLFTD